MTDPTTEATITPIGGDIYEPTGDTTFRTRVDPLGALIIDMRTNAVAVVAMLPDSKRILGNEKRVPSPCVVVASQLDAPSLTGPRTGVRDLSLAFRCYAPKSPTGDILAKQLASAVADYLHQRGPRKSASGVVFYISRETNTGPVLRDPDTDEPVCTVLVTAKSFAYAA